MTDKTYLAVIHAAKNNEEVGITIDISRGIEDSIYWYNYAIGEGKLIKDGDKIPTKKELMKLKAKKLKKELDRINERDKLLFDEYINERKIKLL